jgi:hypothetical protein
LDTSVAFKLISASKADGINIISTTCVF